MEVNSLYGMEVLSLERFIDKVPISIISECSLDSSDILNIRKACYKSAEVSDTVDVDIYNDLYEAIFQHHYKMGRRPDTLVYWGEYCVVTDITNWRLTVALKDAKVYYGIVYFPKQLIRTSRSSVDEMIINFKTY